jgi:transcriptional regulator with XRE-family HTH domain
MGVLPTCHLALRAPKPKGQGYPKAPKTLGEHLRRRRMDLGLIQADVAGQIGVCEATVWNWEKGHSKPEIRHLPAIIAFLGENPHAAPQTIGERLIEHRQRLGWSQKRLAAELGVDSTTLSRWELGKKAPWGVYAVRIEALWSL